MPDPTSTPWARLLADMSKLHYRMLMFFGCALGLMLAHWIEWMDTASALQRLQGACLFLGIWTSWVSHRMMQQDVDARRTPNLRLVFANGAFATAMFLAVVLIAAYRA